MEQTKTILKKTWVVAALACVCCLLWGSAIPLIKIGYRLMQMDSADTASQIVFAGVRFALAGILVLIFASLRERKVLLPDRTVLKYAVPVCMAQTVCQYFFDGMSVFLLLYRCGTYLRCKRRYYHRSWEFYCDPAVLPCFSQGKNDRAKDAWLYPGFCRRGRDQSYGKFSGCRF